jgi:hypothetical protein
MIDVNILFANVEGVAPYALTYIDDVSWSETLVGDLGMVIGGTVLGLGAAGVPLAAESSGEPQLAVAIVTGAASVGGYAADSDDAGRAGQRCRPRSHRNADTHRWFPASLLVGPWLP